TGVTPVVPVFLGESSQANLELVSGGTSAHSEGSGIHLVEALAGSPATITDGWSILRDKNSQGSALRFCYGTNIDFTQNPCFVTLGSTGSTFWLNYASSTHNAGPIIAGRRSEGTVLSPTAVTSGDYLARIGGYGYTGSTFYLGAYAAPIASENWGSTNNGTGYAIFGTPTGTNSVVELALFGQDQTFSLFGATSGSAKFSHQ